MTPNQAIAKRSIGSMFYALFGGAWIALAAWRSHKSSALALLLVAAFTAALFVFTYSKYRLHRAALVNDPDTPEKRRRNRWFHIVNGGQWIVILVAGNVLANIGLSQWVIPAAIFIVGLHFLPLARLLDSPTQYVTGAAFLIWATTYPIFAPDGATHPEAMEARTR